MSFAIPGESACEFASFEHEKSTEPLRCYDDIGNVTGCSSRGAASWKNFQNDGWTMNTVAYHVSYAQRGTGLINWRDFQENILRAAYVAF